MSDYIIKVENLGKKYRICHQQDGQRYVAMRDVISCKVGAGLDYPTMSGKLWRSAF